MMKNYEITYRTAAHYEWLCTMYVQAKDNNDACSKALKRIREQHGKGMCEIVTIKEEK